MTRTMRSDWTAALIGALATAVLGCAAAQENPAPSEAHPKRFFLTSLAQSNQYVIEGPAMLTYVEAKGSFLVGRNAMGGAQYVGPLSGPISGQFFVPEGYFVSPQNIEGAVYSGLCFKASTCFRPAGVAAPRPQ